MSDMIKVLPEVPQVAFTGGQPRQRVEDLFQNELPVLLITREHLKEQGQNDNSGANLFFHSQYSTKPEDLLLSPG